MEAFASAAELGIRMKRTFAPGDETIWIDSLLEDASAYLREDVIGQQVFPTSTSTFKAWPDAGSVTIPAMPLISIDSVQRDGVDVAYTRNENTIFLCTPFGRHYLDREEPVDITFTYGYATAPAGLKRWAMVLVSQAIIPIELKLGLTAGGLSSVAIDDFKAAFADAGAASGMVLSDRAIESLRAQYSTGGVYMQATR